jgi:hypothetical protein
MALDPAVQGTVYNSVSIPGGFGPEFFPAIVDGMQRAMAIKDVMSVLGFQSLIYSLMIGAVQAAGVDQNDVPPGTWPTEWDVAYSAASQWANQYGPEIVAYNQAQGAGGTGTVTVSTGPALTAGEAFAAAEADQQAQAEAAAAYAAAVEVARGAMLAAGWPVATADAWIASLLAQGPAVFNFAAPHAADPSYWQQVAAVQDIPVSGAALPPTPGVEQGYGYPVGSQVLEGGELREWTGDEWVTVGPAPSGTQQFPGGAGAPGPSVSFGPDTLQPVQVDGQTVPVAAVSRSGGLALLGGTALGLGLLAIFARRGRRGARK